MPLAPHMPALDTARFVGVPVLLALAACGAPATDSPYSSGALNFEPETSMDIVEARIANEICPEATTIEITSGPEPSLDPALDQVTFVCIS